jgi:hypothetical protein
METNRYHRLRLALTLSLMGGSFLGCGPRVTISTGTTIGLKASPGDGSTRPPQVTLGYKRAETSLVPTAGKEASSSTDAFSTLAAVYFKTEWFGKTELRSFIGTGHAARDIQANETKTEKAGARGIDLHGAGEESTSEFWDQVLDGQLNR